MSLSALPRTLALLEAIIADGGRSSVAALARSIGMPVATAHRHVSALVEQSFLAPAGYGRHIAGARLRVLGAALDEKQIIANAAAPILDKLATRTHAIVQLGTFDNDMVTYRLKTGRSAGDLFTKVGMQLEAYCSGIGKVLLAHLPMPAQAAYLESGPFIALTERTITDPALLAQELGNIRVKGFATDDEEVALGLRCVAVPVRNPSGEVIAAISASRAVGQTRPGDEQSIVDGLLSAAAAIEIKAF